MTNSVKDLVEAARAYCSNNEPPRWHRLVDAISAVESEGDGWIEIKERNPLASFTRTTNQGEEMNLIFIAAMFMFQMTARMPSPSDVPPIMEEYGSLGTEVCDGGRCVWLEVDKLSRLDEGLYRRTRPTCADKTRFLMTSEDGKKHCIRIEALGGK